MEDLTYNKGVFANVEVLRTVHEADQVTLLRRYIDQGGGIAWVIKNDDDSLAYAVVHDGFKTDNSGYFVQRRANWHRGPSSRSSP